MQPGASGAEARPLGPRPRPQLLALAASLSKLAASLSKLAHSVASKAAHSTAFD